MRIRNCSKAFKALYGKVKSDKHVNAMKKYAGKYYKQIGSVAVITSLVAICAGTMITNASNKNVPVGVMMTVSDVAAGQKAFHGEAFAVTSVTYTQMQNTIYDADQLAKLEKSEKQIEGILASRQQSKKEQAAVEQLTAQAAEPVMATVVASETQQTVAVATYADENGTYELVGDFTLTAYCPCTICCGQWSNPANPTTASGTTATAGRTIAADTSRFPFGTQLVINGQVYTVEDVGGAIQGNKIDIYFNTHQEAINFGRQSAQVYRVVQ
ncbi:MAG: 3D domain-containing protein [Clostridium sp.]|nr:3D domain-containing protein [Clostridium sp.]MCM1173335.1 3D domain-containing protein [Clostridium sp.]